MTFSPSAGYEAASQTGPPPLQGDDDVCYYRTTDFTATCLGGAIVLDLTAAIPPPTRELPDVHMTLLFRRGGFDAAALARVQDCVNTYVDGATDPGKFQLCRWGRTSDMVLGPLAALCAHVQQTIDGHLADRFPHVALRAASRR